MSELIAEARVLVTPDTTAFRAALVRELAVATKGVAVPVNVVPSTVSTAAVSALTAEQLRGADAARRLTEETKRKAAEDRAAAAASATHARQLGQTRTGALSAVASLVGLRGATLAATGPFLAGAAGAIAFTNALKTFASFEQQLNVFAATTGATADELDRVSASAKALGRDISLPGVTAGDAAEAMTEFAKAGLTVNEAMVAARGGLQLATAAQISNADAVELAASALNAFNLAGEDAVKVADVLANAANLAQGGIQDTALALRQAAGAAAVVGVSFEDTAALLTLLARNGLTGSDAGTALRTAFIRLVNPSKEANKVLRELNVNLRDVRGNVRPEVFAEFARAQRDLSAAAQQSNAAIVFGQDAFRAFGFLGREGAAGLAQVREGLDRTGTAAELASARTSGIAGSFENLRNQISNVSLEIGQSLAPALEGIVDSAGLAVGAIGGLVTELGDLREAARQPIKFVVDVIPGDGGGGGGLGGFVEDLLTESLPGQIASATENVRELTETLRQGAADFEAIRASETLPQLIDNLNKVGGSATEFNKVVLQLKAFEASMKGGSKETEGFRERFSEFLKQLQELSQQPDIELPIKLPPDLLSGAFGPPAAEATADSFFKTFNPTFEEGLKIAAANGMRAFADAAKRAAAEAGAEVAAASTSALSGLDLAVARAQGNQGEELGILRERERRQEEFLNRVLEREQTPKNVALATKAAKQLEQTRAAIEAILNQQTAAAKAAADKVVAEAKAADQTFLNGLATARQNQENEVARAANTAGAQDDIRETTELRKLVQQQIALVRASTVDEKTKEATIQALTAAKIAATGALQRLNKAAEAERAANRQAIFDRTAENASLRTQIAVARGNDAAILSALDAEIANQKKVVARAEKARKGVLAAQLKLEQLRKQRRELLKQEEDAVGGTSLADLFRRAEEIAGGAGNVGFTTTGLRGLSASPRIQAEVQQRLDIVNDPAKAAAARQQQSTQNLIQAIDRLTAVLTGNTASGTPITRREQNQWKDLSVEQRFFYQKQAKMMVEQGLVG